MKDALLYFWGILAGLYTHPQGPGQIPGQNFTHHPIPHVSKSTIKPPVISIELLSASLPTRWDRQCQVLWNSLKWKMLHECMHLLWLFYLLRWSQQLPAIFWTFFVGKYFGKGRKLAEEVSSNHFCKGDQSHVDMDGEGAGQNQITLPSLIPEHKAPHGECYCSFFEPCNMYISDLFCIN